MATPTLDVVISGGSIKTRKAISRHLCRLLERDPMMIASPGSIPYTPLVAFYSLAGPPDLANALPEISTSYEPARMARAAERANAEPAEPPAEDPMTCATALAALEERFPLGAAVELTSGGPPMTVESVYAGGCCGGVGVIWMDNNRVLQRDEFEVSMLRLAPTFRTEQEIPF